MVGYAASLPNESIVDVTGTLVKPENEIKSCSIQLEMNLTKIYCVNLSKATLPFQMKDAGRRLEKGESEGLGDVKPGEEEKE